MGYDAIVKHYEDCFDKFGDKPEGVDWTRPEQVDARYRVMLEIMNFYHRDFNFDKACSLLDFGCGLSHLYDYIKRNHLDFVRYRGLEISEKFYAHSKRKHPENKYYLMDILSMDTSFDEVFDFVVMNGVFTEKRDMDDGEMFDYFRKMIHAVFPLARKGVAFNVMSKQVDWEKDFLFHMPLDMLANFLTKEITRDFVIRNDYGLYEYTVYLYKFDA